MHLSKKLIKTIENLYPSDLKIILFISKNYETILNNPFVLSNLQKSKIKILYLEENPIATFESSIMSICMLVSSQNQSISKAFKSIDIFLKNPKMKDVRLNLIINPRRNQFSDPIFSWAKNMPNFSNIKSIIDLNFDFLPLEDDLIHFCLPIKDFDPPEEEKTTENMILKTKHKNDIILIKEALIKFQTIFGKFECIAAKGSRSEILMELLQTQIPNFPDAPILNSTLFPNLLIFDRSSDFVTPLITPWTFLGLIDETSRTRFGNVTLPIRLINPKSDSLLEEQRNELKPYFLYNTLDILYEDIKDKYFPIASQIITETLKKMTSQQKFDLNLASTNQAMQTMDLVAKRRFFNIHFELLKRIEVHLKHSISIEVIKFEQEIMNKEEFAFYDRLIELVQIPIPLEKTVKLIMLVNICLKGFQETKFKELIGEMVLSYGPEVMKTIFELESRGFFINKENNSSNFELVLVNDLRLYKSKFEIVSDHLKPDDPADLSVPYGRYVPISIRIIENLITRNKNVPKVKFIYSKNTNRTDFLEENTMVLCFIGGLTFAEMACIRKLGAKYGKSILVLTTDLLNTGSLPRIFMSDDE